MSGPLVKVRVMNPLKLPSGHTSFNGSYRFCFTRPHGSHHGGFFIVLNTKGENEPDIAQNTSPLAACVACHLPVQSFKTRTPSPKRRGCLSVGMVVAHHPEGFSESTQS